MIVLASADPAGDARLDDRAVTMELRLLVVSYCCFCPSLFFFYVLVFWLCCFWIEKQSSFGSLEESVGSGG